MQIDRYVSERRKKQKKRRIYIFAIIFFLAVYFVFLGVFMLFVRLPAFQAEKITIQGNSVVSSTNVMNLLEAVMINKGYVLNGQKNGWSAMLGFNNMLIWPAALPSSTVATIPQLAGITIAKNYFLHTITVTVTERQPFAIWCTMPDDACVWFDNQGIAFEPTLDTQGGAIIVVHDYTAVNGQRPQQKIALDEPVLPEEFLPNLISIVTVLQQSGVSVQDVALNDLSQQEIDVTTTAGAKLYFSLRFPSNEDLGVLQSLMAKPGGLSKLQYIDFTVENRAYYK
jgi:cell division septal protein FtsQ